MEGASWVALTNKAPGGAGVMIQLTDGTVMVQNGGSANWMRMTPDANGSYANGTWLVNPIAAMSMSRLYFASIMMTSGKVFVLGGEYSSASLGANWTPTGEIYDPVANSWSAIAQYPDSAGCPKVANVTPPACYGDVPAILLSPSKIFAGNLVNQSTYTYDIGLNTWTATASKVYNDASDEESWTKLPDGRILTYDVFKTIATGTGFAEIYSPSTDSWASVSPSDGTATGSLPNLTSVALGYELGASLRLQDGRIFVIGANNHTALYSASGNNWAAGPDIMGVLNGINAPFGADDAPAAMMTNGHVLLAADAGPAAVTSAASTTAGSNIVTGIASTATFQVGWAVKGPGIPMNTTITSVDSVSQIHMSKNATATAGGVSLTFGGLFSAPTQIFDYNPAAGTILPVTPAIPDALLNTSPAYVTRMVTLPTGQVLFGNGSNQLYLYTPDGPINPATRPVINQMTYKGGGLFTVTGKQLNGQSAGASYGDDVENDANYPIVRMVKSTGGVFYCRTTNWSSTGVASGPAPETVDLKLNPGITAGTYAMIVSAAGTSSFPLFVNITQAEVNGQ